MSRTALFGVYLCILHQNDASHGDLAEFVWFEGEEVNNARDCQDSNHVLILPLSYLLDDLVFFDYQQGFVIKNIIRQATS